MPHAMSKGRYALPESETWLPFASVHASMLQLVQHSWKDSLI